MSLKEQLKVNASVEKEKLKNMTFKDKLWYIWEYYKFHIFGVLLVIVVIATIGSSIYRSTFDTELYCMYINNRSAEELNTDILTKDFHDYMGFGPKQLVSTESSFVSYGEQATQLSMATTAKISALIAAKELDVMITDQENFDHYAQLGGFSNLEEELPADVLELVKEHLHYAADDTGVTHAYGISLDGTRFAEASNLVMEQCLFGIVSNSTHKENNIELIRYIFAQ